MPIHRQARCSPKSSDNTVSRVDRRFTATYSYPDGASWAEEVVQIDRGRKYRKAKAQFGEFQVINDEGDLELWDEQGRIETLKKVDR